MAKKLDLSIEFFTQLSDYKIDNKFLKNVKFLFTSSFQKWNFIIFARYNQYYIRHFNILNTYFSPTLLNAKLLNKCIFVVIIKPIIYILKQKKLK